MTCCKPVRALADLDRSCARLLQALGRPIRYPHVALAAWSEGLRQAKFPEQVVRHLSAMAEFCSTSVGLIWQSVKVELAVWRC